MPTLDEVLRDLQAEAAPEAIDFNAPEPGAFPPAFTPSTRTFTFKLADTDAFGIAEIGGKKYLQVTFAAVVNVDGVDKTINYQRASTFKSDKMPNSRVGDLIRTLGLKEAYEEELTNTDVNTAITSVLQAASGRAVGAADFGWTAAFKDSLTIYQTAQTKKYTPAKQGAYTRLPWPRNGEGHYAATVADPATGQEKYPNLEIVRFRMPKAVTA